MLMPNPPFDGSKPKVQDTTATIQPVATKPSKIGDRIGNAAASGADNAPVKAPVSTPTATPPTSDSAAAPLQPLVQALPVTQRAAIVVQVTPEDRTNTSTYIGTVVWRSISVNGSAGQPLQNIVQAEVDIPEAKTKATVLFQNNLDPSFPASHTIKIKFAPAEGSALGPIKAIDVPEMRDENAAGMRLVGLAATIAPNNFLAALATGDAIVPHNLELVRNRGWLDIPFQTAKGLYGKMVLEKGPAGERVINDALASWGN